VKSYIIELTRTLTKKEPVSMEKVVGFQKNAGFELPLDYKEFLVLSNGAEGFVGENSYVMLWTLDELMEFNKAYQVPLYVPELFLFGSDGGGEAFAFNKKDKMKIVKVPFVGMDISLAQSLGSTFIEFLENLRKV